MTKAEIKTGFQRQRRTFQRTKKREELIVRKAMLVQRNLHDAALRVCLTPCGPLDVTQPIFRAIVGLAQALLDAGLLKDCEVKRGEAELNDQVLMVNMMIAWVAKTGCRRYPKHSKRWMGISRLLGSARYALEMIHRMEHVNG